MKKILLVGTEYFPLSTPGAFRLYAFSKHLPEFGYKPHILTLDWDEASLTTAFWGADSLDLEAPQDVCPVTRLRYRFPAGGMIRKRFRCYTVKGLFPLSWPFRLTRMLFDNMESLHKQAAFDAVLATGCQSVKAGHALHTKYDLPWVIDFRDVSGQYPTSQRSWTKPWRWLHPAYEKWATFCERTLAHEVSAATTVSQPLAEMLGRRGFAEVTVIHNGFDPDEFPPPGPRAGANFRIVHAGTIVPGIQSPASLLDALDILCQRGEISAADFSLDFYGESDQRVRGLSVGRRCGELVRVHHRLGKRGIHKVMTEAGVLLHLSVEGHRGILTSKLTEYLGAKRPILSVPGDQDVVDQLLERTRAGVSMRNPEQIAEWILRQYRCWKPHGEYVVPGVVEKEIEKYTWREQVKRLARLLDRIADSCGPPRHKNRVKSGTDA